jgi:hypothetical protein
MMREASTPSAGRRPDHPRPRAPRVARRCAACRHAEGQAGSASSSRRRTTLRRTTAGRRTPAHKVVAHVGLGNHPRTAALRGPDHRRAGSRCRSRSCAVMEASRRSPTSSDTTASPTRSEHQGQAQPRRHRGALQDPCNTRPGRGCQGVGPMQLGEVPAGSRPLGGCFKPAPIRRCRAPGALGKETQQHAAPS